MKTKKETKEIINLLKKRYPKVEGMLDFTTPFEITIAVLLSAQATDASVNKATPKLFAKFKSPKEMLVLSVKEIEEYIKTINFYRRKAESIYKLCRVLVEDYDGVVPNTMEELVKLPGIGRKSANVIMLSAFNNPQGIAVDTHAKRIANRVGLSSETDPSKVEEDLLKRVDTEDYFSANHLFVMHGRNICTARNPKCDECPIYKFCNYYKKD